MSVQGALLTRPMTGGTKRPVLVILATTTLLAAMIWYAYREAQPQPILPVVHADGSIEYTLIDGINDSMADANALAKQLGPKGVHVAYLVIDGVIDTLETRTNFAPDEPDDFFIDPKHIADAALYLARQDRSAWPFEMDIRPFKEKW